MYLYLNQAEDAIQVLEASLDQAPSADTRLRLIDLYEQLRQYLPAVAHARYLTDTHPERWDFWKRYTSLLATAERKTELVEALQEYTARWPEDRDMQLELADAHEWVEDYPAQLQVVQHLFAEAPERDGIRERLARAFYALGRYEPAAAHYAHLLARHPTSPTFRQGLRAAIQDMQPGPRALTYAEKLYQATGPAQAGPALLLAGLYEHQEHFDQALVVYDRLAETFPDSARLHADIGRRLLDRDHRQPARSYFLAALQQDRDNTTALSGLAEITLDADPRQALRYLQVLERHAPRDPETIYRLALTHEVLSDSSRMVSYFQRFLDLVHRSGRTDVFFLRQKARARYRTGSAQQALELLEQARRRYPDDLDTINDYAEILIALRQYDRALEALEEVPGN